MQVDLAGKVALVTGSSYGISKAIALKFAENGSDIVVNARHPEAGMEVVQQIKGMGRQAIFEPADVNKYPEVAQMANNVIQKLGHIDILVASGGRGGEATDPTMMQFFRETDPETYVYWAKSQWLNRLYCVKAVLDHMIDKQAGKIIMIGADAGRWPTPGESMVGGSAAALVMATKVLAAEFAQWQIRINTLCLTVARDTPTISLVLEGPIGHIFKKALDRQPFPTTSADVAEAALFLASKGADQITGQILSVNGGLCFPG